MDKPEALTQVELLERVPHEKAVFVVEDDGPLGSVAIFPVGRYCHDAAAELRRLQAQRDALLEACKAYDQWADETFCCDRELRPIRAQIRAAIAAVEGEKK